MKIQHDGEPPAEHTADAQVCRHVKKPFLTVLQKGLSGAGYMFFPAAEQLLFRPYGTVGNSFYIRATVS